MIPANSLSMIMVMVMVNFNLNFDMKFVPFSVMST